MPVRARSMLLVGIACIGVLVAIGTLLLRNQEPRYEGWPLSAWLRNSGPKHARAFDEYLSFSPEASNAVYQIGTNAIPILVNWLAADQTPGRRKIERLILALPRPIREIDAVQALYFAKSTERRATAAMAAFTVLGPKATNAIPELTRLVSSTNSILVSRRAMWVLMKISSPAASSLADAATNRDSQVRIGIVRTLGNLGTNARPAIPTLTKFLQDPDPSMRMAATNALRQIAPEALTNAPAPNPNP